MDDGDLPYITLTRFLVTTVFFATTVFSVLKSFFKLQKIVNEKKRF